MRKEVVLAALGFLIGAAAIVGGQEDDDLREELRRLQDAAARVAQQGWEGRNAPPANARGQELRLFPVYDLTCGVPDFLPPSMKLDQDSDDERPLFGGPAEERVQRFGTIEELMELVRGSVRPESWDSAQINAMGQTLVVLNDPTTNRDVAA